MFGTWPIALLSANKKKVKIEGPVCDSSQVIGWHLRQMNNESEKTRPSINIHISSFGFNSSILWDPERWGRPSALQKYSQVPYPPTYVLYITIIFIYTYIHTCIHIPNISSQLACEIERDSSPSHHVHIIMIPQTQLMFNENHF